MSDKAYERLSKLFRNIPLGIYRTIIKRDISGFFYHIVSDNPPSHTRFLYPHRPIELFDKDIAYLAKNYTFLSYPEIEQRRSLIRNRAYACLSFDDGFSECYSIVRPILLKYGIPCIFFLATDFIDNKAMYYRNKVSLVISRILSAASEDANQIIVRTGGEFGIQFSDPSGFITWLKSKTDDRLIERVCEIAEVDVDLYLKNYKPYLSVDQILALSREGFTIGAHSKSHHKLGKMASSEADEEILESCQLVSQITGQSKVPFSFPNSGEGLNRDHLNSLRDIHPFVGLFFDTKGMRKDRDIILNRIWVEAPKFNRGGNAPLPRVLQLAYEESSIQTILRIRSRSVRKKPAIITGSLDTTESPTMID